MKGEHLIPLTLAQITKIAKQEATFQTYADASAENGGGPLYVYDDMRKICMYATSSQLLHGFSLVEERLINGQHSPVKTLVL